MEAREVGGRKGEGWREGKRMEGRKGWRKGRVEREEVGENGREGSETSADLGTREHKMQRCGKLG